MGEGWSDWYAKDFIVEQFPGLDTATPRARSTWATYTDTRRAHDPLARRSTARSAPRAAACPAAGSAGSGGFTYGDFGKIDGASREVHADGEIWAQTLWDLRARGRHPTAARRLITDGMRLSPPEPSFLDMRNAILLADQAAGGGAAATPIWTVFAQPRDGLLRLADDARRPPLAGLLDAARRRASRAGRIAGVVTDVATGRPIAGATAAIGGARRAARTSSSGRAAPTARYSDRRACPSRTYPSVVVTAPGYDRAVRRR